MSLGICLLSQIPGRSEPDDRAEIVTQILFGESFIVLKKNKKWSYVQLTYDNYKCWICNKQYKIISNQEFDNITGAEQIACTSDLMGFVRIENTSIPIVLGSTLPNFDGEKGSIDNMEYTYDGSIIMASKKSFNKQNIVPTAFKYLNAPYLWGGRSPFGIDCSGLTQMVYKMNGIKLPRDAKDQAKVGESLSFVEEAQPGDLAFFDNQDGEIVHVGIILEGNRIIHASGKVRIDQIDHQGIFNQEIKDYSHKLRLLKKVV